MPQPVKLSDPLIDAAREAADLANRSLAAQVEHWATLGRAIEGSLTVDDSTRLKQSVHEARGAYRITDPQDLGERIANCVERTLQPEFSTSVRERIAATRQPTYGAHPDYPGKLVRRAPDGALTPGQLQGRTFVPDESPSAA